jgi:hypothetical protein
VLDAVLALHRLLVWPLWKDPAGHRRRVQTVLLESAVGSPSLSRFYLKKI